MSEFHQIIPADASVLLHTTSQIFHPVPWMENPAAFPGECEATAATGRLVVEAIDLQSSIMAEQQRTDGAVTDEENIARLVSAEDLFHLVQNAPLRIDRAFPAPDTDEGMPKKSIGDRLELFVLEETCR